jgi:hypothetical protein
MREIVFREEIGLEGKVCPEYLHLEAGQVGQRLERPQVEEVRRSDDELAHVDGFSEKTFDLFSQRLFVVEVGQLQVDVEVDQRTFNQSVELFGDESDFPEKVRRRQLTEDHDGYSRRPLDRLAGLAVLMLNCSLRFLCRFTTLN